jgi:hypothetical protein
MARTIKSAAAGYRKGTGSARRIPLPAGSRIALHLDFAAIPEGSISSSRNRSRSIAIGLTQSGCKLKADNRFSAKFDSYPFVLRVFRSDCLHFGDCGY